MGWLFSIFLFALGAMAVYPVVVQTWPASRQVLDKLMPHQSVIGIVAVVWGLVWGLRLLARTGAMMGVSPIIWLISLAGAAVGIAIGVIFGYGLIAQNLLRNNPQLQRRGDGIRARLVARQEALGWAGMLLGAVGFLMFLVR
jgi:hypothetical protein